MALLDNTQLRFSEIEYEFGENPKRSLGEYRIKQTIGDMSNLPLDKVFLLEVRKQVLVSPQLLITILP